LPLCLPPFVVDMIGLTPRHILRQGDPPWGVARIPKILHKDTYKLKKWELILSDKNKLEQTHPRVDDPFP
jgi:hypothetical protein